MTNPPHHTTHSLPANMTNPPHHHTTTHSLPANMTNPPHHHTLTACKHDSLFMYFFAHLAYLYYLITSYNITVAQRKPESVFKEKYEENEGDV